MCDFFIIYILPYFVFFSNLKIHQLMNKKVQHCVVVSFSYVQGYPQRMKLFTLKFFLPNWKSIFQFFGRNKRLNFVSNPVASESSFKNESVSNMKRIIGQNVECFPGGRKDD